MKSNSLLNPDWIWVFLVEWVPFMNHSEKNKGKKGRGEGREGGGETNTPVPIIMDPWLRLGKMLFKLVYLDLITVHHGVGN